MKNTLYYLVCGAAALGVIVIWGHRLISPGSEPPPQLVQDMTRAPKHPYRPAPVGIVPFAEQTTAPRPESSGQELFLLRCAACHGTDGTGSSFTARQPGMPDVSNLTTTTSPPEELLRTLTEGRGAMPAFGPRLSDEQRRLLIQYITSLRQP